MKKLIYLILLQFFMCAVVFAASKECIFSDCAISPELKTADKPGHYMSYNDLTKMPGEFENEYANKILLRGIVVDKECIPVANAKIMLWQLDEYGDYRYNKKFATIYDKYKANYKMYGQFKGNGSAVSNNTGKFSFITVNPSNPKKTNILDGINAMVVAPGFNKFETKVFIHKTSGKDKKDKSEKGVIAYLNVAASKFYSQEVYDVYIVLNGLNKYRRY